MTSPPSVGIFLFTITFAEKGVYNPLHTFVRTNRLWTNISDLCKHLLGGTVDFSVDFW